MFLESLLYYLEVYGIPALTTFVQQIIPGGAAHKSGRVTLGDCITHVNASDVSQLSLEETLLV